MPGSLRANVNNTTVPCAIAVPPGSALHDLDVAYLSIGLNTQKQIYAQLEDSLYKPMTLSPDSSISIVRGNSGYVDWVLKSDNGISGAESLYGRCLGGSGCPAGFDYYYDSTSDLPAYGTIPIHFTFDTQGLPALGIYNYEFWVVINGAMSKSVKVTVTVTASPVTTGTINISMLGYLGSASCSLNGGTAFTVPTSPATILTNQLAGTKNLSCQTVSGYTMAILPSANQTLLVGRTIYYSLVFTPTPATPTITITPASNTLNIVRGNSSFVDLTLTSKNGATGTATIQPHCLASVCPAGFTYNFATTTTLSANGTVPLRMTFYTTATVAPGTYNYDYQVTLNGKTVVATITVVVTAPVVTTGTVVVSTTGSVATSCILSGVTITAPVTLTNQTVGTKSLNCTAPIGYTLNSVSPTSQTLTAGGTANFVVNLTAIPKVTTGTVNVTVSGYSGTVTCTLNGSAITAPVTLTSQSTGSKSLSCSAPSGYSITIYSTPQALSAGGMINFALVVKAVVAPQLVLSSLTVNTAPKVNTNINVSLFGSGFVSGAQAYICSSPSGGCSTTSTVFVSSGQLSLPSVRWSSVATIYIKVVNPSGLSSGFVTMVVVK